jgi:hypothetical protein
MSSERKLIRRKCPGCGHEAVDPLTVFRLPGELEFLAQALELPEETVTTMLDRGAIPVRRWVDKNGRAYGPLSVLFADAVEAVRGSGQNIS